MITLITNPNRFSIVAISRDEAIVWREGLDTTESPLRIKPPVEADHRHMRTGQFNHGHDTEHRFPEYFEEVSTHLRDAESILILEHGKGNGNYGQLLAKHFEKKHPDLAEKVVDHLTVNIPALSVHELEAYARGWFEKNYRKLGSWHGRKADRRFT
jgi:hypothetical protein